MKSISQQRQKSPGASPLLSPRDVGIESLPAVKFSPQEMDVLRSIANRRAQTYDSIANTSRYQDQDLEQNHIIGVVAEAAVYDYYGGTVDFETYEEAGDDGVDLVWHDITIDVKATTTDRTDLPDLLVPAAQSIEADYYFLVHVYEAGKRGNTRLIGLASGEHVASKEPQQYPSSQRNRVVPGTELTVPPAVRFRKQGPQLF